METLRGKGMTQREMLKAKSKDQLIDFMYEALKEMQAFNNRPTWDVVNKLLGGERDEEGYYRLITIQELQSNQ